MGIADTGLRWRMTPEQARAAVPAKNLFEELGSDGTREFYQLNGLISPGFAEKQIEWLAILSFEKNQLVAFDLRPWRERVTPGVVGDADAWSDYLSLASYRAKVFDEVEAPKLRAVSEVQTAVRPLGATRRAWVFRSNITRGARAAPFIASPSCRAATATTSASCVCRAASARLLRRSNSPTMAPIASVLSRPSRSITDFRRASKRRCWPTKLCFARPNRLIRATKPALTCSTGA